MVWRCITRAIENDRDASQTRASTQNARILEKKSTNQETSEGCEPEEGRQPSARAHPEDRESAGRGRHEDGPVGEDVQSEPAPQGNRKLVQVSR